MKIKTTFSVQALADTLTGHIHPLMYSRVAFSFESVKKIA